MAHAPLLRTSTAPVFPPVSADGGVVHLHRQQNSMSVTSVPRASQLSGSTVFTNNSSLESLGSSATMVAVVAPQPGNVVATNNIINQKADASRSLYQICVALKQRLRQVPGFDGYMQTLEEMSMDPKTEGPVESLWSLLRTGEPLLAIFNALNMPQRLAVDDRPNESEEKRSKRAIMKFVQACVSELNLPTTERFIINDLTGGDTTGFVKVGRKRHPSDRRRFLASPFCRP